MKNRGGLICRVRLAFVRNQKCEIGNLLPSGRDVIVDGILQLPHCGPELRGILHCDQFRGEVNYLPFGSRDGRHPGRMPNKAKRTLYRISVPVLCGAYQALLRPFQALFFFIQKASDLCGQFDELVGVLLGHYLLAEHSPAFTIFGLHKGDPRKKYGVDQSIP